MEMLTWVIVGILWIGAFASLIYPILPGSLFIIASYFLYGWLLTFDPFNWVFWVVQVCFFLLLFTVDYLANAFGVKKYGGTKAGVWGSTIGLLLGPFIIPFLGILIGPFLGAILGELLVNKTPIRQAIKIGFGSVLGFIGSVFVKGFVQAIMVVYFLWIVL